MAFSCGKVAMSRVSFTTLAPRKSSGLRGHAHPEGHRVARISRCDCRDGTARNRTYLPLMVRTAVDVNLLAFPALKGCENLPFACVCGSLARRRQSDKFVQHFWRIFQPSLRVHRDLGL